MNALEIVKQAYVYLNEKDIPNYFSLMSPNVEFYQTEELPWGGHYHGFDESKVFFSKYSPLVDSTVEISHYIQAGNQTVAIGKTSGVAKRTGKPFHCSLAHIWTIKADKIVRLEVYIDTAAMNAALA
jgi:uncharacterized protein